MGWRGLKWAHSLFAMGTVAFGNLWAQDVFITVDQFGYRPAAKKVAVLRSPESGYDAALSYVPGTVMEVVDSASNKIVFSGAPVAFQEGQWIRLPGIKSGGSISRIFRNRGRILSGTSRIMPNNPFIFALARIFTTMF